MNFTWDFNPTALLALIGGLFTVIRFGITSTAKIDANAEKAAAAEESARLAHEKVALLQAAINANQITQAERLVSREILREVEDRLTGAIEKLGDRLDNLVKELITHRKS